MNSAEKNGPFEQKKVEETVGKMFKWWQVNLNEKRLIEFGWLWWDIPGLLIPNYFMYKALEPLYRRIYGVLDFSNHA